MVEAVTSVIALPASRLQVRDRADRVRGYTLVELVVTLSVLTVLVTLAAPAFAELVASQRVQIAAMDLLTSLLRTRSEAIKQNVNVTMSPAGSAWSDGWVVEAGGQSIDVHKAAANVSIVPNVASVTYRNSGRISGALAPRFEFSSTQTATKRCVQIDLSGRPVVTRSACPD